MHALTLLVTSVLLGCAVSFFDDRSEITMVVTSCARLDLLKKSLASFFHQSTEVSLYELIIIDDCSAERAEIQKALPMKVRVSGKYQIIINEKQMGHTPSLQKALKMVTTRYSLNTQDDWQYYLRPGYLQDAKSILEWASSSHRKISQVIFGRGYEQQIVRGQMQFTDEGVGFFPIQSYRSFNPTRFSYNPHLLDVSAVFKSVLHSQIVRTLYRNGYCIQFMNNNASLLGHTKRGPCYQSKLGAYLYKLGYQAVMIDADMLFREVVHIGDGRHVSAVKQQQQQAPKQQFTSQLAPKQQFITQQQFLQQQSTQQQSAPGAPQQVQTFTNLLLISAFLLCIACVIMRRNKKNTTSTSFEKKQQQSNCLNEQNKV